MNELVKACEEEFGVSAAAGVVVAAAGADGAAGGAEKDEFDVELTEVGAAKVKVIFDEDDFEDMPKEKVEFYKNRKIKSIRITKRQDDYLNRYIV